MPAHPRTKMTCLRVMRGDGVDVAPAAAKLEGRASPVSPNKNQKQAQQRERRAMVELHQPSLELAAISYSSQELKMPLVPSCRAERETQLEERLLAELQLEARRREPARVAEEESSAGQRRGQPLDARLAVSQRRAELETRESSDLLDSDYPCHHYQPPRRRRSRCTQTDHYHQQQQQQAQQPPCQPPQREQHQPHQSSAKSSSWWRELSLGRLLASFVSYLLGRRPPSTSDEPTSASGSSPKTHQRHEATDSCLSSSNSRLVEVHDLDGSARKKRLEHRDGEPLVPCKRVDDDSLRLAYMHGALKASSRRCTDDAIDNDEYHQRHGTRRGIGPRARQLSSPLT